MDGLDKNLGSALKRANFLLVEFNGSMSTGAANSGSLPRDAIGGMAWDRVGFPD